MKRISELKVPELHDELTKRGLPKKGKKQNLFKLFNSPFKGYFKAFSPHKLHFFTFSIPSTVWGKHLSKKTGHLKQENML